MRTFGIYPQLGAATLDIVPNDYVGQAIAVASRTPDTVGQIFHLCSGPAAAVRLIELRALVRQLFRQAGRMGWLPQLDFSRANFLRIMNGVGRLLPERERRAINTLPVYLDYLSGIQQFGNDLTTQRLAALGVAAPDNQAVLAQVLRYYLNAKRA